MTKKINIIPGHRCYKLTVMDVPPIVNSKSIRYFLCKCDCGNEKYVSVYHLAHKNTKSCGCWLKENPPGTTHGCAAKEKRTREYITWATIKQRCQPSANNSKYYSEKGIKMCERWAASFPAFLEDMGTKPTPKHTIDRIEGDKGYYKENCRWATVTEQNRNQVRNRWISYNKTTMLLVDWSVLLKTSSADLRKMFGTRGIENTIDFYLKKNNISLPTSTVNSDCGTAS